MRIGVVGAGVIGLSIAHELAEAHDVTVVHELPTLETTSAVAGAQWFPFAAERSEAVDRMLAVTLERFRAISAEHPEAGVDEMPGVLIERGPVDRSWTAFLDAEPVDLDGWVPGMPAHESDASAVAAGRAAAGAPEASRAAPRPAEPPALAELRASGATALRTSSPLATMSQYLPWLEARCRERGVRFVQRRVGALEELTGFDAVVVATGLGARELLGDDALAPARGQVVRIENPGVTEFLVDDDHPDGLVYLLPRRDCLVLGGTYEPGADDLRPDPATEAAIIARCATYVPAVADARILARRVGLRPGRARVRVERVAGAPIPTIAAVGHGGSGMTLSWGTAERVAALASQPCQW